MCPLALVSIRWYAVKMVQFSDNTRGALFMMGSMTAFTINDAFMKALSDELPLFQALFVRGLATVICLSVLCAVMGQLRFSLTRRDWGLLLLRAIGEVGGAYFFITALFHLPIANVSAILQALPLTVSLAAAVFLREALGWRRVTAICVGFCGVLLIVRPGGADFNIYSLYALAAVACVTLRDVVVRRLSPDVPSVLVALIAAIAVMVFGGFASLLIEWQPFTVKASLQLGGSALFIIFGYVFSVAAMRVGEIGFVAPFRYTSLLVALVLGVVVFGAWPSGLTLVGAFVVVATGLFTLYRERRLRIRHMIVPDRIR